MRPTKTSHSQANAKLFLHCLDSGSNDVLEQHLAQGVLVVTEFKKGPTDSCMRIPEILWNSAESFRRTWGLLFSSLSHPTNSSAGGQFAQG